MVRATLAGLLLLFSFTVAAQTQWYTVELIAFQHLSNDGLYTENWPDTPGKPATHNALRLGVTDELSLEDEELDPEAGGSYAFQLLDTTEFELTDISNRLKWSEGYRPLLHIAWRQPGFSRSQSRAVHIHTALPNPFHDADEMQVSADELALNGTIRVSRARYLHVDADLLHHRLQTPGISGSPERFRMRQSRRMRSKELHYLDHPLFGLLVQIIPYDPEEIFSEQEETTEPSS